MESTIQELVSPEKVKKASLVLRAVNHKLRMKILRFIDASGSTTVTEIYKKLRIEQSVCSQQLSILRKAGVVVVERNGRFMHYALNPAMLLIIEEVSDTLIQEIERRS